MKRLKLFLTLIFVVASTTLLGQSAVKQVGNHTVRLTVVDKKTKESVIMASCEITPLGSINVTDVDGKASFQKVPDGNFTIKVTYVGYEPFTTTVKLNGDLDLAVQLEPTSLSLKEVVVTAKQGVAGSSTSSTIGRQAIDHLQATSLADIMQLVPGHKMGNTDLTQAQNIQLRTLTNNNTSAFGSSVVVDGVPMSNNANVGQGGFNAQAFAGTDLRNISADNIDNVEVIRGIPSAEYGDLTSGLIVVHSKAGVTPWQVKAKINPSMTNASLGKGFSMGKAGIFNFNIDYAKAWGDPRQKTRSFNRYSTNLGWGYDISPKWHTNTKLRFLYAKNWTGNDPDAIQDGTYSKNKNISLGFTHNGRISVDKLFMRTLNYTFGVTYGWQDDINSTIVANPTGLLPVLTATETGYYAVPWMTQSYLASGQTQSRPGNIFAKINDSFYFTAGKTRQTFKLGAEYHYDWNSGKGYFNDDETRPLKPNSDGRPRAFSDVPGIHQVAAYVEDNFLWTINKVNKLRANLGVRFTSMQPFSDIATTAVSPRFNVAFSLTKWLDLRAGFGLNSKTPGQGYLYPDKKYVDNLVANYMPQNDPQAQFLMYHTNVYEVQYSKNLKNATTTKIELGVDVKLPGNRRLSLLAYRDRTPNGFGPLSEWTTYTFNRYTPTHGLVITPGAATTVNPADPDMVLTQFMTTGAIGNTNTTINKGIEMDFDLGEIKPIRTSFQLSGAYSETKTYSTDANSESVKAALLPGSYATYGITPFRVFYPSGQDYSKYRQFLTTLNVVTHIPALKMVASFMAQAIWYDYTRSFVASKDPIAYMGADLVQHGITADMMGGYLDMQGNYSATQPAGVPSVAINDLRINSTENRPTKNPVTWNLQGRLTKELGKIGGFSIYVNNMIYYEPYLKSNLTTTLTQRNTGNFSFGAELYFNL